jgi:hypothetical protein
MTRARYDFDNCPRTKKKEEKKKDIENWDWQWLTFYYLLVASQPRVPSAIQLGLGSVQGWSALPPNRYVVKRQKQNTASLKEPFFSTSQPVHSEVLGLRADFQKCFDWM